MLSIWRPKNGQLQASSPVDLAVKESQTHPFERIQTFLAMVFQPTTSSRIKQNPMAPIMETEHQNLSANSKLQGGLIRIPTIPLSIFIPRPAWRYNSTEIIINHDSQSNYLTQHRFCIISPTFVKSVFLWINKLKFTKGSTKCFYMPFVLVKKKRFPEFLCFPFLPVKSHCFPGSCH